MDTQLMQDGESHHIPWHAAFIEAIQLELDAYRDILEFHPEYQLTAEPLRIDCVVMLKKPSRGFILLRVTYFPFR